MIATTVSKSPHRERADLKFNQQCMLLWNSVLYCMGFVVPRRSRTLVVLAGKRGIETEVTRYVCIYVYYVHEHCKAGGLCSVL